MNEILDAILHGTPLHEICKKVQRKAVVNKVTRSERDALLRRTCKQVKPYRRQPLQGVSITERDNPYPEHRYALCGMR